MRSGAKELRVPPCGYRTQAAPASMPVTSDVSCVTGSTPEEAIVLNTSTCSMAVAGVVADVDNEECLCCVVAIGPSVVSFSIGSALTFVHCEEIIVLTVGEGEVSTSTPPPVPGSARSDLWAI